MIGQTARRESVIREVSEKDGKTGKLAFVKVSHRIFQHGEVCVEEEQDIVYREPGASIAAPRSQESPPFPTGSWTRIITPDPVLLFRFSALTFNAHRIHYDRNYAMNEEGYPGIVVHGQLTAMLLMELVRAHAQEPVIAFTFRGQSPLFDLAPFRLIATPAGDHVQLEAHGPDGKTALTAVADLATKLPGST